LGVYATRAHVAGHDLLGATNIGRRPTFDAGHISIETHLMDFEGDIYGERMEIEIVQHLRGEVAFPNVDDLVAQIGRDVEAAREALR
jgi:riboflavin kinase/FMN adenylyltransferase